MTKSELRKICLEKQKSLSDFERSDKSRRISDRFFEFIIHKNISFLHLFIAIEKNREVETSFIYQSLWRNFPENAETTLSKNRWQIFEPTGNESVEVEKIDAVLVPLLCFDERGFRVGYGKGFYDKFLSECREDCLKIGLSYFAPVEEIDDAQNFDVKLDFCITPQKIFSRRNR